MGAAILHNGTMILIEPPGFMISKVQMTRLGLASHFLGQESNVKVDLVLRIITTAAVFGILIEERYAMSCETLHNEEAANITIRQSKSACSLIDIDCYLIGLMHTDYIV